MLHSAAASEYPGAAAGLLTTTNEAFDRVAMHAVRRELLEAQAEAAGLPLHVVPLPWPCSNERRTKRSMDDGRAPASSPTASRTWRSAICSSRTCAATARSGSPASGLDAALPALEDEADRRPRPRHDRRRPAGAAHLRRSAQARPARSPAARSTRSCWTTCRPASTPAARTASSTRLHSPARCSTIRFAIGSARSSIATDSLLRISALPAGATP